jgi:Gluconate 2-dehydrogenase subunit 3
MNKNQDLTVSGNNSNPESGINRREMVRRLMMAGGAGFALPAIAEGQHPANKDSAAHASAKAAAAEWRPAFLDRHQSDTLAVVAERIIPGSSKAQVNRFIDLLLSVDTQGAQKKFLASLSAFEAESLKRYSHPYKDLSETQQNEILTSASTGEHGKAEEGQPERITMRDHFETVKSWVSEAYYSSEVGMKELGWTGQVFFTSFPGCQDPGERHS